MPAPRNTGPSTEHRRGGASGSSLDAVEAERLALQELRDRKRFGLFRETLRRDHADDISLSELPVIFLQRCDGRAAHKKVGGHFHVAVQTGSVSWWVCARRCRGLEPGRPCAE